MADGASSFRVQSSIADGASLCRGWMLSHVQLMLTPSMWGVVCALVIALPTYWGDATYKKHIGKYNASEFLAALPSELDAAPKVIYRIRDAIGSVGKVGSSPDTFFLDPFSAATASSFLFAALQLAALPWLTQQNSDDTSVVSALMLAMICAGTTLFHQEGSVGGYPVRVDIFAMEITFVWLAIMCARAARGLPTPSLYSRPPIHGLFAPPQVRHRPRARRLQVIAAETVH